jgi:hypothetical protein
MNNELSVVIRVMPNMDDVEISVPQDSTSNDIVEALLDSGLGIPRMDNQSNPISYQLVPKGKNEALEGPMTVGKAQIQNGDIILMLPRIIAG